MYRAQQPGLWAGSWVKKKRKSESKHACQSLITAGSKIIQFRLTSQDQKKQKTKTKLSYTGIPFCWPQVHIVYG